MDSANFEDQCSVKRKVRWTSQKYFDLRDISNIASIEIDCLPKEIVSICVKQSNAEIDFKQMFQIILYIYNIV